MIPSRKLARPALLLLVLCLFMTGCYRGMVTRRINHDNDEKKSERANPNKRQDANQTQYWDILSLRPGNWALALVVVCGCILGFLFLWSLLKSMSNAFDSDLTTKKGAINDEKTGQAGTSHQDQSPIP